MLAKETQSRPFLFLCKHPGQLEGALFKTWMEIASRAAASCQRNNLAEEYIIQSARGDARRSKLRSNCQIVTNRKSSCPKHTQGDTGRSRNHHGLRYGRMSAWEQPKVLRKLGGCVRCTSWKHMQRNYSVKQRQSKAWNRRQQSERRSSYQQGSKAIRYRARLHWEIQELQPHHGPSLIRGAMGKFRL